MFLLVIDGEFLGVAGSVTIFIGIIRVVEYERPSGSGSEGVCRIEGVLLCPEACALCES